MPLNKDSLPNTFLVVTLLCLTCALIVSAASVTLRPLQLENAQLDRRNNILQVSGFTPEEIKEGGGIKEVFESRLDVKIIDLDTGDDARDECQAAMNKAKSLGLLNEGDLVVQTAGTNTGVSGSTDLLKVGIVSSEESAVNMI